MRFRRWRFALACVAAVSATLTMVVGGSAGNRALTFEFKAVPGPAEVTYGQNIAYRAKLWNTSGSMLTHVIFRMAKPYPTGHLDQEAAFKGSTCPQNDGQGVWVTNTDGTSEWTCDLGNLPATTFDEATPQVTLSIVWGVRNDGQTVDCSEPCLQAFPRVSVKEGLNDQTDPNDVFTPTNQPAANEPPEWFATLLASDSDNSQNTTSAGGYETTPCSDVLTHDSLRTKQKLDPVLNKVSTKVCISEIFTDVNNLGLATTIREGVPHMDNPGNPNLETSDVCVAQLGFDCGAYLEYPAQVFDSAHPLTLVFQIPDSALGKGEKITKVWHNYNYDPADPTTRDPLGLCGETVPFNGCLVGPPTLSKGKDKVWTIVMKTLTNGWATWG
jgi:hypothetical protein